MCYVDQDEFDDEFTYDEDFCGSCGYDYSECICDLNEEDARDFYNDEFISDDEDDDM